MSDFKFNIGDEVHFKKPGGWERKYNCIIVDRRRFFSVNSAGTEGKTMLQYEIHLDYANSNEYVYEDKLEAKDVKI